MVVMTVIGIVGSIPSRRSRKRRKRSPRKWLPALVLVVVVIEMCIRDRGSALALVLSSFVGALVGASLYHIVSPHIIRLCAGGAFVVVGILMLLGKI